MQWREITLQDGTVLGGGNNFPKERDELFENWDSAYQMKGRASRRNSVVVPNGLFQVFEHNIPLMISESGLN